MEVFIGTPSYSKDLRVGHVKSLIETVMTLATAGVGVTHHVVAGCPFIGRARNEIVDAFLMSDATDLLFIDSDVGFDTKALHRFLHHKQEIVCGLVPKRDEKNPSSFHMNALTGVISDNGLFESLEVPTAFMRIKRSAFAKIAKPYFRAESSDDAFGEDIYFCRKWVAAGEKFWVDSDIDFTHTGDHVWKGNFYDHCVKNGILQKAEAA